MRVLLTRAPAAGHADIDRLRDLGALVREVPLIRIVPPPDERALAAAVQRTDFDWIAFTSVQGVEAFARACGSANRATPKFAAVGPATARAIHAAFGRSPELIPTTHTGAALGAALAAVMNASERVLLVQALDARPDALESIAGAGCAVETVAAYATIESPPDDIGDAIRDADVIVLASGSAVRSLHVGLGAATESALATKVVICIGPVTAAEARHASIPVTLVPREYTMNGVIDSLVERFKQS